MPQMTFLGTWGQALNIPRLKTYHFQGEKQSKNLKSDLTTTLLIYHLKLLLYKLLLNLR